MTEKMTMKVKMLLSGWCSLTIIRSCKIEILQEVFLSLQKMFKSSECYVQKNSESAQGRTGTVIQHKLLNIKDCHI